MNGSWNSLPDPDWKEVLAHAGKDLDLKRLITAVHPLSRVNEAFNDIFEYKKFHCKTLLECQA